MKRNEKGEQSKKRWQNKYYYAEDIYPVLLAGSLEEEIGNNALLHKRESQNECRNRVYWAI